jgi:serine/threonine-protein kinase
LLDAADWPTVSALFDQALDLPRDEREGWLASLPPEYDRLKPALSQLLRNHASIETKDFLERLPEIEVRGNESSPPKPDEPQSDITLVHRPGAETQDFAPPKTVVGLYRITRLLGRGGMGSVWLAERTDGLIKRPVALKLPHVEPGDTRLAERLARERDILAGLAHPHIARLYDAGLADGQPYLALEYVEGVPIGAYCDEKKLSVRDRVKLFLQVIEAVQYAHSRLVIHRDLKPSNVLVGPDGQVRLLDFGIAKLIVEGQAKETELTQIGGRALTPNYASPEQITGLSIGTASDVYSLGVILYELLAGALPYRLKRDSRGALEDAILAADPQKPSGLPVSDVVAKARSATPKKLAAALRGDLDTIVLKALKKQPEERYTTAEAFGEDIERYLRGDPVRAQPDRPWYRARKLVTRNPVVSASVGGALLALVIGLGISIWQAERAREQAKIAEREAKTAKAVQTMLQDIFQANSADQPDPQKAQQTTARELLDIGEKKLQGSLKDEPAVRIAMLGTLVDMYMGLDMTRKAYALANQRVEEARRFYGDQHAELASALMDRAFLGGSVDTESKLIEADLKEAEKILDGLGDKTSERRGHFESAAATYYLYYDETKGEPYADRSIAILRNLPPSEALVSALWVKANLQNLRHESAAAEETAREAMTVAGELNGKANSSLPMVYTQLAVARDGLGDIAGGIEARRDALQLSERLYGSAAADTLDAAKNYGGQLCVNGQLREGVAILDRASEAAATMVANGRSNLPAVVLAVDAACWTWFGQTETALKRFGQISEWRKGAAFDPPIDGSIDPWLAETLTETGDVVGAQAALDRARDAVIKMGGRPSRSAARRQTVLYMSMGRYADAARALEGYDAPESDRISLFQRKLLAAEITQLSGEAAAAELGAGIAADIAKDRDRAYLKEFEMRAELLAGRGLRLGAQPQQALPRLLHALDLAAAIYDPEQSVRLARAQIELAQCYLDLGKPAEAWRLFLQAQAIHRTHKTVGPQYASSLKALADRLHAAS